MSWTKSADERRLWRNVALYLGAIYLSLWPLQFALDLVRRWNLLRVSIAAVFVLGVATIGSRLVRRRAGPREWAIAAATGALYAFLATQMTIVQERLHLVEYGALAWLVHAALAQRRRDGGGPRTAWTVALVAFLLSAAAGWIDELIQGVLPNRRYDLRDVGFNALASAIALVAVLAADRARQLDRGAERRGEWTID